MRLRCVHLLLAPVALGAFHPLRATAQGTTGVVAVRVSSEHHPLADAVVRSGSLGTQTDAGGIARLRLAIGAQRIITSKIGYSPDSTSITIAAGSDTTLDVELHEHAAEISGVVVSAMRGQRRVEDEPTRVDVLNREEVEEQTAMTPGNVSRFLQETGGVRVVATSPGLGGANVRVLGLRGRYTQLLSDGLPLYGLSTEGLGLLQIPPVDLRQVELIKGAASALYGPSALGGVVNFLSRRPGSEPVHQLWLNQTTQGGRDAAYFDSRALSARWGYTLLATGNVQARRGLNADGWADVPGYDRGAVRPRLYWTGANGNDVFVTTGFTSEDRRGGTVDGGSVASGGSFVESRRTQRADAGTVAHFLLDGGRIVTIRSSATQEWGTRHFGDAQERDRRNAIFGEATLTVPARDQEIVIGAAFQRDRYTGLDVPVQSYSFTAPAIFAQHTWTAAPWVAVTSSARLDLHNVYGTTLSPRIAALFRPTHGWTARLSAGAGTFAPTPFVEETEEIGLALLRPIRAVKAERAGSLSADVGGVIGPIEVNAAVHASVIDHAVGLRRVLGLPRQVSGVGDSVELVNADGPTRTHGAELFARYRRGQYKVTGTYAFLDATEIDPETGGRRGLPLTPKHAAGLVATWEPKDDSGLSVEVFYTGRQSLADNPYRSESQPFVMFGALARWRIGRSVLFLNGENLSNVRQTHFDPLLRMTPGLGGRRTTDAWAPLDGAVVNVGVRLGF